MRDLADGKVPGGYENGDAFREMAAAIALPVDVDETQDAFIYTADVPGLEKGDLKVCPLSLVLFMRPRCSVSLFDSAEVEGKTINTYLYANNWSAYKESHRCVDA